MNFALAFKRYDVYLVYFLLFTRMVEARGGMAGASNGISKIDSTVRGYHVYKTMNSTRVAIYL